MGHAANAEALRMGGQQGPGPENHVTGSTGQECWLPRVGGHGIDRQQPRLGDDRTEQEREEDEAKPEAERKVQVYWVYNIVCLGEEP